jgi:uncharacterized membrane protein
MENPETLISSPLGVLSVLVFVAAFFFFIAEITKAKLFDYLPPLLFIYALPVVLTNTGVIPANSSIYGGLSAFALPAFIVLMLINVNVPAVVKVMGKGVFVMLMGTAGVVVGAVVAYLVVNPWLPEDAWKGFGALAGSWIGGTGNLAATAEMLQAPEEQVGLAIIADQAVYLIWLPLLLTSRDFAERFNRWARVPDARMEAMDKAAEIHADEDAAPRMTQYLYLAAVVVGVTWFATVSAPGISGWIGSSVPALEPVFSTGTTRILLVTTVALILSVTPVARLPNSTALGTAIVYVFVAGMGARASLSGLADAPVFVAGAFIWITIHGLFCLAGAWIFRVDVHSVAIASAANIGGAASAPIVAAHHRPNLVPVAILMALLGYALGNSLAPLAGNLARIVAGQ